MHSRFRLVQRLDTRLRFNTCQGLLQHSGVCDLYVKTKKKRASVFKDELRHLKLVAN